MIREPCVAGRFYSGHAEGLKAELDEAFRHRRSQPLLNMEAIAGVVPHAGYMFSGPCAAAVYRCLRKTGTAIVLGFSHSGRGRGISVSAGDWRTPLGVCRTDKEAADKIAGVGSFDESAFEHEHSIEVQVPFIQHVLGAKIVAVCVSRGTDYIAAGKVLAQLSLEGCTILASSDFTHFGPSFGYVPFSEDQQKIKELDMGAVELITGLDREGFEQYVGKTGATICGSAPISLLIEAMKVPGKKGRLLSYYTSSDITGDSMNSVSYAGIGFEK